MITRHRDDYFAIAIQAHKPDTRELPFLRDAIGPTIRLRANPSLLPQETSAIEAAICRNATDLVRFAHYFCYLGRIHSSLQLGQPFPGFADFCFDFVVVLCARALRWKKDS